MRPFALAIALVAQAAMGQVYTLGNSLVCAGPVTLDAGVTINGSLLVDGGVQLSSSNPAIWGTLGASSGEVVCKAGTSVSDGSTNAAAKLLSLRTGLGGGTEVEKFYVTASGDIYSPVGGGNGKYFGPSGGTSYFQPLSTGAKFVYSSASVDLDNSGLTLTFSGAKWRATLDGLMSQSGTDSSGSPGAATINKPRGISAIAIGASSVTITNSLAATTSHILITPLARDTTCKELAVTTRSAGSFAVTCTANATAAVPFAWEVGGIL